MHSIQIDNEGEQIGIYYWIIDAIGHFIVVHHIGLGIVCGCIKALAWSFYY
jgi:hypothetical protein